MKKSLLSTSVWKIRLLLWSGAIMVGIAAAIFAISSEYANELFKKIVDISPFLPFVLTPSLLMLVAFLTNQYFPGSQGSGIPQAIAALHRREHTVRNALISWRIAIGKILLTLLGLLAGSSIGREGPTVHVGASIMFSLGKWARFPFHYMDRGLILAGSAAGIAAAFNTPLAGIVFAIEEMSRSFEQKTSGTILTAVVLAGITAIIIQGSYTYFGTTNATLPLNVSWLAILVCGVVGGAAGGLFSHVLVKGSRMISPWQKKRPLVVAALCGLGIALIGYLSGNTTYGTGYAEAKMLVTGTGNLDASFPIMKFLASVISYLSGIPGGIFAPSLATGAGLGTMIADWFSSAPATAIVLLGMVGYFSGVVQAPITAFVIVMEMSGSETMLLPLMLTAMIAHGTSRLVCPEAVYEALAVPFLHKDWGKKEEQPKPEKAQ